MTNLLGRLGLERREQRAWALYDVANSAWMTTVMTTVFPPFFVALATAAGLADADARSRFAFASGISVILVGLSGPVLGAIADLRGAKKRFLAAFVAIGVAASAALYFSTAERWPLARGRRGPGGPRERRGSGERRESGLMTRVSPD